MQYNVETPLNPRMVEHLGKNEAVARLTFEAWYRALKENQPSRSLVLVRTEVREGTYHGLTVELHRFIFEVD